MNPYKILKIKEDATPAEIKSAYRRMAAKYHPDHGGDAWIFQQIQEAYDQLSGAKPQKKEEPQPTGFEDSFHQQSSDPFGSQAPPRYNKHTGFRNHGSKRNPRTKASGNSTYLLVIAGVAGTAIVMTIAALSIWLYLNSKPSKPETLVTESVAQPNPEVTDKVNIEVSPVASKKEETAGRLNLQASTQPSVPDETKTIQQRIKEPPIQTLEAERPSNDDFRSSLPTTIDLLATLAGSRYLKDGVNLVDGKLMTPPWSNKNPNSLVVFPVKNVPEEYDIRMHVQRIGDDKFGCNFGFLFDGHQGVLDMDGSSSPAWCIAKIDGKSIHDADNPTRTLGKRLPLGTAKNVTIRVRSHGVEVLIDRKRLINWEGNGEQLSVWKKIQLPDSRSLFLYTQAAFIFHEIKLIPFNSRKTIRVEPQDSFKPLFNGEDFTGWQGVTSAYSIEDGAIVFDPKGKVVRDNIFTTAKYQDFILKFKFKLSRGANNGLAIHYSGKGDPAYTGKEIQILDNGFAKYRKVPSNCIHGSVWGVLPAKKGYLLPRGQWNEQTVEVRGTRIKVVLNGTKITDGNVAGVPIRASNGKNRPGLKRKVGFIGFAGHTGRVSFRDISIKELPSEN